jgi:hypothetical protein
MSGNYFRLASKLKQSNLWTSLGAFNLSEWIWNDKYLQVVQLNATYDTIAVVPWGIYASPIELLVRNAYGRTGRQAAWRSDVQTHSDPYLSGPDDVVTSKFKSSRQMSLLSYCQDVHVMADREKYFTYGIRRSKSNITRYRDVPKFDFCHKRYPNLLIFLEIYKKYEFNK